MRDRARHDGENMPIGEIGSSGLLKLFFRRPASRLHHGLPTSCHLAMVLCDSLREEKGRAVALSTNRGCHVPGVPFRIEFLL
jgi:hypothetical protein